MSWQVTLALQLRSAAYLCAAVSSAAQQLHGLSAECGKHLMLDSKKIAEMQNQLILANRQSP